jgi:hypothetical protein
MSIPTFGNEEKMPKLSLERVAWARVDRFMPARPKPFLLAVVGIVTACWLIGLMLAPNKLGFLASREWQFQPLFLGTHFVCLRLFVTCYTRNFLAGAARMDVSPEAIVHLIKELLGPLGGFAAVFLAMPFCLFNYVDTLVSDSFATESAVWGAMTPHAPVNMFLFAIWCLEWVLNAYIWVLILGFLALTIHTLWYHKFRASIDVMLHEKHYRPFLIMSAEGATIVLFFGAINAAYVWYTHGDVYDYIGLAITGGLLLVGFGPPWMQLKSKVEYMVNQELFRLEEKLVTAMCAHDLAKKDPGALTMVDVADRLDSALALLRVNYLERMHRDLGRAEGRAVLLKLLAPASAIGWRVIRTLFLGG